MREPISIKLKRLLEADETDKDGNPWKVICAWCGAHIKGNPNAKVVTSHGMCRRCLEAELDKMKKAKEDKKKLKGIDEAHQHSKLSPATQRTVKMWLNDPSSPSLAARYANALELDIPDVTIGVGRVESKLDDRVFEFIFHLPGNIRSAHHSPSTLDTVIEYGISVFRFETFGIGAATICHWRLDDEKANPSSSERMLYSYREYRHLLNTYDIVYIVGVVSGL